ncbi:MAG: membrane protein insertion efficiency factor YidD [Ghiorsea sp.]
MRVILIGLVRFYRYVISPMLPARCRFMPTCSEYAIEALERYGALKGSYLTVKRLLRCHPFSSCHGYDPLP